MFSRFPTLSLVHIARFISFFRYWLVVLARFIARLLLVYILRGFWLARCNVIWILIGFRLCNLLLRRYTPSVMILDIRILKMVTFTCFYLYFNGCVSIHRVSVTRLVACWVIYSLCACLFTCRVRSLYHNHLHNTSWWRLLNDYSQLIWIRDLICLLDLNTWCRFLYRLSYKNLVFFNVVIGMYFQMILSVYDFPLWVR